MPGLQEGLRPKADEALVGKPDASTPALAALFRAGNPIGLNAPRNVAAAIATGLGNGRSFSQNYELSKDQKEAFARQAPKAALPGTVAGIGTGALALPGLTTRQRGGRCRMALPSLFRPAHARGRG